MYQKKDDPQEVYLTFDMDDITGLSLLMNDPDLEATMKEAGVISKPEITILNEV